MDLAQVDRVVESKIYDTLQWQVKGQLEGCGLGSAGAWVAECHSRLPSPPSPDLDPLARVLHEAHGCSRLL